MRSLRPTIACAFLVSCAPPAPDVLPVRADAAEAVIVDVVPGAEGGAVALDDLGVVTTLGGDLVRQDLLGTAPVLLDAVADEAFDAATLADGEVVVATEDGLARLVGDALLLSPHPDLAAIGPARLVADGAGLWIAPASGGLLRWRDGALASVAGDVLPVDRPALARGPDPAAPESWGLWVAGAEAGAWFVRAADGAESGDGLEASPEVLAGDVRGLATDAGGTVWIATSEGVVARAPDGSAVAWELPDGLAPDAVLASTSSPRAWVFAEGHAFAHQGASWDRVEGLSEGFVPLDVDPAGRLLGRVPERGLVAVTPRRELILVGELEAGAGLEQPAEVHVFVSSPVGPRSITAAIDGDAELAVETGEVASSLVLDPLELEDGPHRLDVVARWRTGEEASASLPFGVGEFEIPTWEADIAPLFTRYCTPCHASAGGAHLLDTRAAWEAEYPVILQEVESGAMPLNNGTNPNFEPLGPGELLAIRAWAAGGFPP